MKLKGLFLLTALIWLPAMSLASVTVYTPTLNKNDVCETIAGHWIGKGKVTAIHIVTCVYKGTGDIYRSSSTTFNMNINLVKDPKESSFLCPANETLQLPGECNNGSITLKTDDGTTLYGTLKNNGKTTDMLGTVMIPVGNKYVKANVDYMHMDKQ